MAELIAFPQDDHRRHIVLIVDDEPAIRGILYDYLSEAGFNPLAVESGDDAVKLLESGQAVDLVFSDVRMPGSVDGFGLARWVMDHRPGLPVLLASGDLGKTNAMRELVGAEILPKPYDFDFVVRRMHAALDGKTRRRAQVSRS
jgi:DNA-binding NtrC family response regulator